jgi:hypothetical protein
MKHSTTASEPPLDLSRWRNVPFVLIGAGGLLALIGIAVPSLRREFLYSWLWAYMFCLSLGLGALFLVVAHHLFDAGWSVPIRRFCEHMAKLLAPCMLLLFLPIAIWAKAIYPWMHEASPGLDKALAAKSPLFTTPGFYVAAAACFLIWWLLTSRLRYWSLEQDKMGAALPTYRMRFWSGIGVVLLALTLTLGAVMWMKGLQHQWFSTMYGVYYFAGSAWLTLSTVYVVMMVLDRQKLISEVMHDHQYYFVGSLLFAFTVFYAYVTFGQYFIIWNANMPEETFWYVLRERGNYWWFSMVIIFGHFFVPFLALLRIDVKSVFKFMVPLCAWSWLMHFVDLGFNIMPVLHPAGYPLYLIWLPVGCLAFMVGVLSLCFLKNFAKYPPYPIKDPRLNEAMGYAHPVPTQISGGELDETDDLRDAPPQFKGSRTI